MAALTTTYPSTAGASARPFPDHTSHLSPIYSHAMETVMLDQDLVPIDQRGTSHTSSQSISTHSNGTSVTPERERSVSVKQQDTAISSHEDQDPAVPGLFKSAIGQHITIGGAREAVQHQVGNLPSNSREESSRGNQDLDDIALADNISMNKDPVIDDIDSKWIHRDKLAQIESRELAEMGVQLGLTGRPGNRTRKKSIKVGNAELDQGSVTEHRRTESQTPDLEQQAVRSSTSNNAGTEHDQGPASEDAGAQNFPQRATSRHKAGKAATSRIPISKSSPIPSGTFEITASGSPVQRFRKTGINNAASRNSLDGRRLRYSGASMASSNVADPGGAHGPQDGIPATPPHTSPSSVDDVTKRRSVPSGRRLSRGGRIVSGPQRQTETSSSPRTDSFRRPRTRDGPRLPVARPEGEAPWIATMFKPDPRLPQDQQMLPTHAKRLAMEQGKIPFSPQTSGYTPLDLENYGQEQSLASELRTPEYDADSALSSTHTPPNPQNGPMPKDLYSPDSCRSQNSEDSSWRVGHNRAPEMQSRHEALQWPLPSPNVEDSPRQTHTTPNAEDLLIVDRPNQGMDVGHSNITSEAHGAVELDERPPQRGGVSSLVSASHDGSRPTRLPVPAEPQKEDKGCGGCCSVM